MEELESDNKRMKIEIQTGKQEQRKKVKIYCYYTYTSSYVMPHSLVKSAESAALAQHQLWSVNTT